MTIDDLNRLQGHVRSLIQMAKRRDKLSGADYSQMTQKKAQQNSADLSFLGMDIDKTVREAHAAAVDCGIADARGPDDYGPVDYRPSGFHHYRHQPTRPRCRAEASQ